MSDKKIVGIGGGKKPSEECIFCDDEHSSMKCPRVKYLELYEDGTVLAVQFFKNWTPPKPPPKAA